MSKATQISSINEEKTNVQINIIAPNEVYLDTIYIDLVIKSEALIEKAKLRVMAKGAEPSQIEEDVTIDFSLVKSFELNPMAGVKEVEITAIVLDEKGSVLESGEKVIRIRNPIPGTEEVTVTARYAKSYLLDTGKVLALRAMEVSSFRDFYKAVPILRRLGCSVVVRTVMDKLQLETTNLSVNEAIKILMVINLFERVATEFKMIEHKITIYVPEDKMSNVDVIRELPDNYRVTVLVKQ
ncbi:MAG: hypothetical protein QXL19_05950 [Ignisphaera sp.]